MIILIGVIVLLPSSHAFTPPSFSSSSLQWRHTARPTTLAASIRNDGGTTTTPPTNAAEPPPTNAAEPPPSPFSSPMERVGINSRGAKMNEIDFTLAPSDVSLSRCYQMSRDGTVAAAASATTQNNNAQTQEQRVQTLSLTRALNTASNRAVRRILLARSWPSAEALNLSLRTVLMQQQQQQQQQQAQQTQPFQSSGTAVKPIPPEEDKAKCPVPRPILNILMNRRAESSVASSPSATAESSNLENGANPTPRTSAREKERQWVEAQIAMFRESYSSVPGYDAAEAYLECILSLATGGVESDRVNEVIEGGVYAEAYRRILSVIQSVGAVLETVPGRTDNKKRIASKLMDQDICLSMLDKIALANEKIVKEQDFQVEKRNNKCLVSVPYDAAARLAYESDGERTSSISFEEFREKYIAETVAMVSAKKRKRDQDRDAPQIENQSKVEEEPKGAYDKGRKKRLFTSFLKIGDSSKTQEVDGETTANATNPANAADELNKSSSEDAATPIIRPDDLGGVLLSAEEPTMTRQLNILSNIVQRTLIFGGDQELLVLSETLDADKPAFIQRWYKENDIDCPDIQKETRPGVQYLNALIQLLRDCYSKGVLYDVTPKLPLTTGYSNAYGRLTASLIELGSGYVRPRSSSLPLSLALSAPAATAKYLTETAPPKSPLEELGRFAKWETAVRKNRINPYPEDLVGTWNVQDMVGGSVIGTTRVEFQPGGEVSVKPPMQGLRWRLDPGPTHLDTCTFQVLSDDGAILQYRGFVDRGSRLEARISKRSVTMRGSVSFLMRDAELGGGGGMGDDYYDDILPLNYKNGMTKFVMSRIVDGDGVGSRERENAMVA
eukprot:CCRYP_014557-RA/>CCRYP_014557-RA protein AED:0.09 eAED:0.09 QI:0/1/0.5/1/1/1/2/166/841